MGVNSLTFATEVPEEVKKLKKDCFGFRLRQVRMERGLSQTDLGKKVGLTKRMVSYYEAETEQSPPGDVVLKFANALQVSTDQMLGRRVIKMKKDPKLARMLRRLERIASLPPNDQRAVLQHIEGLLARKSKPNLRAA